jgi:hypothetical protein
LLEVMAVLASSCAPSVHRVLKCQTVHARLVSTMYVVSPRSGPSAGTVTSGRMV